MATDTGTADAPAAAVPVIDSPRISRLMSYSLLIGTLRTAFGESASAIVAPPRHSYSLPAPSHEASSTSVDVPSLLVMPAWSVSPFSPYIGVKLVTVFPNNTSLGLPSVSASYLLSSALTGVPLAFLDGKELTLWRTACVSALAADYLAPQSAEVLLMVGAGDLAPHLVLAHMASRPSIRSIFIWNRTVRRAHALGDLLRAKMPSSSISVDVYSDLQDAAQQADLITCATLSREPLVQGSWLKAGAHLDLVGSFSPSMRECDDEAIRKGRVYIDTDAAGTEAGEIAGAASSVDIEGTLSELVSGRKRGRQSAHEITVFKSVGSALADLAAAQFIYDRHKQV